MSRSVHRTLSLVTLYVVVLCLHAPLAAGFARTRLDRTSAPQVPSDAGAADGTDAGKAAREGYGDLPLSFESNRGQTDERVDFVARGAGYTLFLTPNEAVFAVPRREQEGPAGEHGDGRESGSARRGDDVIRMRLVGATSERRAEGLDELPGRSNYFLGDDPGQWHTDVPSFARVRYEEAYPGVDLLY